MKIYYITNAKIPTEKAHGLQIAKTCEALGMLGVEVELIVPSRDNLIEKDIFEYYKIKNNFKIKYIKSYDWFRWYFVLKGLSFKLQSVFFWQKLKKIKIEKDGIIYTRTVEVAWLFSKRGYKVFYEAHVWPGSKIKLFKNMLADVDGIIANSKGTVDKFRENGFENILVASNGVDLDKFKLNKIKKELRQELDLSIDKKIVMYVGHLYKWKGVDLLIEVADNLKAKKDIMFVLVGGTRNDEEKYKKIVGGRTLENFFVLGYKPTEKIPNYLMAADVLVLPNIPITEESKYYTSPIKMFEYMASRTPIVAADLESIGEILNKNNAILFKAGDVEDLEEKIKLALKNNMVSKTERAGEDVKEFTWQKRAQKIIEFIDK